MRRRTIWLLPIQLLPYWYGLQIISVIMLIMLLQRLFQHHPNDDRDYLWFMVVFQGWTGALFASRWCFIIARWVMRSVRWMRVRA
jgi:hypothetical protein